MPKVLWMRCGKEWEKGNWIGVSKEVHLRDIEISLEMPKRIRIS
jgi:hypothetical protein